MVSKLLNYQSWKMGFEELERGFEGPPVYDTDTEEEGWFEGPPLYDTYPDEEEEPIQKLHGDEVEEKDEKTSSDLEYKHSLEVTKSKVTKENEGDPEPEVVKPETNASEKKHGIGGGGFISKPLDAIAKPEGDGIGGDLEPPVEQVTWEAQREEEPPEPPEPPDGGVFEGGSRSLGVVRVSVRHCFFLFIQKTCMFPLCSVHFTVKRDGGDQNPPSEGLSPEGNAGGATATGGEAAAEEWPDGDSEFVFSLAAVGCTKREVKMARVRVGWNSLQLNLRFKSLGQAQKLILTPPKLLVSNSDYYYIKWGVLEIIREVKNINPHLCISLAKAFPCVLECKNTNTSSQTTAKSTWDQFINISPLSSFINVEAMGRNANPITHLLEEFALYLGVAYSKNRAAAILCFLLKNTVENRAFDPGGNFSVLYITQSSYFKLWNPLFSNYLPLQQYPGLSFTIEAFMAFLNFYRGDSVISMASIHYHKILGEPQEWSHRIPPLQSEFEFSKESIDLLYEWFMGFVGDLNGTIENKPLKLHDKEEENNVDFAKSKWHKLMMEHIIQMVESTVTHKWDPGGLTIDGWNLSGTKRDEAIQEIPNIFVLENHENQFQQYFQAQVERNGQWNYEQGTCKLIFKALVICMTKLYLCGYHEYHSEICKLLLPLHSNDLIVDQSWIDYAVLRLEEDTWLVLFFEGGAMVILAGKWNGVLMLELVNMGAFHSFISHRIMVLVLCVIPNYEGGAQNGEGLENLTQAWLPTRKEIWVEHLIQGLEYSKVAMAERHHKQWDPGEPYSASGIMGTSCIKLWDPGERPLTLLLSRYLHLEDKVNFEGGSIDENLGISNPGETNKFGKVYSRKGRRVNVTK